MRKNKVETEILWKWIGKDWERPENDKECRRKRVAERETKVNYLVPLRSRNLRFKIWEKISNKRERDSETLRVRKIKDYAIMVLKIKKQTEREKKKKK